MEPTIQLTDFLDTYEIPYLPIYVFLYIKPDGTIAKKQIGEINNLTIEEIEKKKEYYKNKKLKKPIKYYEKNKEILLTEEEKKTLVLTNSLYLKYTSIYCIDIDEIEIKNLDDYITILKANNVNKSIIKIIKKLPWTTGNTKGIHIYIKVDNVPNYTNQIDVLNFVIGDFLRKTNNVWEKVDKELNNFNSDYFDNTIDFNLISSLFKNGLIEIEKPKKELKKVIKTIKEESKETIKEEPKEIKKEELKILIKKDETKEQTELREYILLCIEHKIFKKIEGYVKWLSMGILIKSIFNDNGFELFNMVSIQMPKYDTEEITKFFYDKINLNINLTKKPISIGTLKKYVKDADEDLYKKINHKIKLILNETKQIQYKKFEFDKTKCREFDKEYFQSLDDYNLKKEYFELFICFILQPEPLYIYGEYDKGIFKTNVYSTIKIKDTFGNLTSSIYKIIDKATGDTEEIKFIDIWIKDINKKTKKYMDFIPYNGVHSFKDDKTKNYYNLFNGYNEVINNGFEKEKKEDLLKPFKSLLLQLCGNEKEHFNYFYNYLSHMIQKPNERIPICFIFKSKEGVGKNVMLNCIGNILGEKHYISSSNVNDFFGTYAEGFVNKILVNLNECEGKNTFDYEGKIKSFITEDKITFNPKYIRQTTIQNIARLIIFTNKANPIPIDVRSKDRRFVVFQSTDYLLDKKFGYHFWKGLVEHFKKPEFISCLYDDLNNNNIDNFDWMRKRPITKAYLEMCSLYVPIEASFLENYIDYRKYNNDDIKNITNLDSDEEEEEKTNNNKDDKFNNIIDIKTVKLYQRYVEYCKKFGFINDGRYQTNITKFNNRLIELEFGILKIKTPITTVFRLCPDDVYKKMVKKNWIVSIRKENENIEIEEDGGIEFTIDF